MSSSHIYGSQLYIITDDDTMGAETIIDLTFNVFKSELLNKRFYWVLHGMKDN
jgi:hypothetical protein